MKGEDEKIGTKAAIKIGDTVQHVDDERVKGKVLELREEKGRPEARIEGSGNWIPAEALRRTE